MGRRAVALITHWLARASITTTSSVGFTGVSKQTIRVRDDSTAALASLVPSKVNIGAQGYHTTTRDGRSKASLEGSGDALWNRILPKTLLPSSARSRMSEV